MSKKGGNPQNFIPGNPGNKGGGRPPEWFKKACADLASNEEVLQFLSDVVTGKPIEEKSLFAGSDEPIKALVSASVKDRVAAWDKLADRGFGKASQEVVQLKFVFEFVASITSAINRVIPDACPHCKKALTLRETTIKELEDLSRQMESVKVA